MKQQNELMEKVKSFIEETHMIQPGDGIVAGVSGGADSVCLLYVLLELQETLSLRLHVVHVNHQLRTAADEEEAYVRSVCRENGISCTVFRKNIRAYARELGCSEEEAGRRFRYDSFEKVRSREGCQRIAVAHHRNDRAETMLFHMARGTGMKGMAGIPPTRGAVIRPLLCLERSETEGYLMQRRIRFYTDETNLDSDYTRNYIRNEVLPLLERVNARAVSHMAELADSAGEYWRYVEEQAQELETVCVRSDQQGRELLLTPLCGKNRLLLRHLLYRMLMQETGTARDLEQQHVRQLELLLEKPAGKRLSLPGGIEAIRTADGLRLGRKREDGTEAPALPETPLPVPGSAELGTWGLATCRLLERTPDMEISKKLYTKMFDYDKIKGNLCIRGSRPGDFLIVNAQGGRKKLSRFFIDRKVPAEQRSRVPVLAADSRIYWVLGMRIGEDAKITDKTERVLQVEVQCKGEGYGENIGFNFAGSNRDEDTGDGGSNQSGI